MIRKRVAVLISGRGSNLAALVAAAQEPNYPAEIVFVASDRPGAAGLQHAERGGIPTAVIDRKAFPTKADFETLLDEALRKAGSDLVCLAGFMRLLSAGFVEVWRDRLLNIHPSLLPAFPGLGTHARALAAGVKIHGATVHFVRAEADEGPIIAQGAVPVFSGDTADILGARVLEMEHRLYPLALKLAAGGATAVVDERVVISGEARSAVMLFSPSPRGERPAEG